MRISFNTRWLVAAVAVAFIGAGKSPAAYLTGVTATTNMGNGFGSNISQITDGSGLSSLSLTATHATATPGNSWVGNVVTGTVDFDLNGSFSLAGMSVWNFNANNIFGTNGVQVLSSLNGVTYTPVPGGPSAFAQGALFAPEGPQQFTFGPVNAAFVRFNIQSNFGFGATASGLSEVGFDAGPVANPVPAPAGLLLGLTGLPIFGALARFRRKAANVVA